MRKIITTMAIILAVLLIVPVNAFAITEVDVNETEEIVVSIKASDVTDVAELDSVTSNYDGGWGQSWVERDIYNDGDLDTMILGAYLPAGVGFTIMAETSNAYLIDTYEEAYVHLAGVWISKTGSLTIDNTAVAATAVTTTTVYGGCSTTNYEAVGSISSGDTVVALAKSGTWRYIEFNDSLYLRKRGWVPSTCISTYYGSVPNDLSQIIGQTSYYGNGQLVYYAPGSGYPSFQILPSGQAFTLVDFLFIHGVEYALINYIPSGNTKVRVGYIVYT